MGIVARHVHLGLRDAARAVAPATLALAKLALTKLGLTMLALTMLALTVPLSHTARAAPPTPSAQRPAAKGYEAYRKRKVQADLQDSLGHPGRAAEALLEAYEAYPDERTLLDAVSLFVRADRHEEALRAAERYLAIARSPEGREVAKRHVADLRQALSQHSAELAFSADPPDATVCLDAVCRPAPFVVWVKAGNRQLSAHQAGLDTRHQELLVKAGEHAAVTVTLRARVPVGLLEVFSPVSGAPVTVDGQDAGSTPVTGLRLPAGAHEISVQREGAAAWTTRVHVKPGDTTTVFAGQHATGPGADAGKAAPTAGLTIPAAPDFVRVTPRTPDAVRYAGTSVEPDVKARPASPPVAAEVTRPAVEPEPPNAADLPVVSYGEPDLPVVPVFVPGGREGASEPGLAPEPPDAPEPVALPEPPDAPEPVALPEPPDAPEPIALPETPDGPDEPIALPETPDGPDEPVALPETPDGPDEPIALPETPDGPDEPVALPETPDGPDEPIALPETPDAPDEPVAVGEPDEPSVSDPPDEPVAAVGDPSDSDPGPDLGREDPGLSTSVDVGGGARWQRITGWTAVGVGLGVLGGAIATHVLAANAVDSAAGLDASSATYLDDYERYSDEAKKQVLMRNLLAPIGGVIAAAGVGLVIWDFLLPDEAPNVGMMPLPEGGFMLETSIAF